MMWKTYNDVWRRVWQFWVPVYLYFWVMFCTIWYLVLILVLLILVQKHTMMWRRGDSQAMQFWFPDCLYFSVIFCTIWYSGCFQTQGFDAAFNSLGPNFHIVGAFQLKSAVQRIWMPFKHIHLIPTLCFCAHFDFSMHFNWAVQFRASGCFSSTQWCEAEATAGKQIPTEMWNFFCGRRVYSQFTHNAQFIHNSQFTHSLFTMRAIHDFPLKFDYLLTIFPCLILHSSKCNFTCHTHRPKADGFGVLKIVWSTDTIYWIDSNADCPCLMLLVVSDLTQATDSVCLLHWPFLEHNCARLLCQIKYRA